MTRKPRTFAGTLFRAIATGVGVFAIIATAVLSIESKDFTGGTGDAMSIRENAPGSPAALTAEHECWTGEAPADMAGKVPGHVIVTDAHNRIRYAGPRMVGKALDQTFHNRDHGIRVHAFCR